MGNDSPDLSALLHHRDFVSALARSLLQDSARAEDVVQETWLTALEHPPGAARRVRAWLAVVVRHLALNVLRSEQRRARRDQETTLPGSAPSAHDVAARMESEQRVVRAVIELAEPYKSAILLRYYEGLPPHAIASKLGVPLDTVRARLRRGLARLREQLAERDQNWAVALAATAASSSGAVVMGTTMKVALASALVLLAAGTGWYLERGREPPRARAVLAQRPGAPPPAAQGEPERDQLGTSPRAPAAAIAAAVTPQRGLASLVTQVFDAAGLPFANATVTVSFTGSSEQLSGMTDASGKCSLRDLPLESARAELSLAGAPVRSKVLYLTANEPEEWIVHLGQASLTGTVIDVTTNAPVGGLSLWLMPATSPDEDGQLFRDIEFFVEAKAITDPLGQFSFERLEFGNWLVGPAFNNPQHVVPAGRSLAVDDPVERITLLVQPASIIRGHVLDPYGKPVPRFMEAKEHHHFSTNLRVEIVGSDVPAVAPNTDGSFVIWPRPPETCNLRAYLEELPSTELTDKVRAFAKWLPSSPTSCAAGVGEVDLRLRDGGALITGEVVGHRESADDQVEVELRSKDGDSAKTRTDRGKRFTFTHLEPGSYNLFASAGDRCALRGDVFLGAGAELLDVKLVLQPGGHLRMVQNDESVAWSIVVISNSNGPVTGFGQPPGSFEVRKPVPLGSYTVECTLTLADGSKTHIVRQATVLATGDEPLVDFARP